MVSGNINIMCGKKDFNNIYSLIKEYVEVKDVIIRNRNGLHKSPDSMVDSNNVYIEFKNKSDDLFLEKINEMKSRVKSITFDYAEYKDGELNTYKYKILNNDIYNIESISIEVNDNTLYAYGII